MLVWDPVTERLLPFGTLKTAALGQELSYLSKFPINLANRQDKKGAQSSSLL